MEKQYLQYKDKFREFCNLKIGACVAGIVTVLLVFFLPLFEWKTELLGLFLEESEMQFSLFDECKLAIEVLKGEEGSHFILSLATLEEEPAPYFYFMFFGLLLFFIVGIPMWIAEIWNGYQGLSDIEGYTVEEYDKIRWRKVDANPYNRALWSEPAGFAIGGIGFFTVYAIVLNVFAESFEAMGFVSHFTFDKIGATWTVSLVAISAVITAALELRARGVYKNIQRNVLKAEYGKLY